MPVEYEKVAEVKNIERQLRHRDIISRLVYQGQDLTDIAVELKFSLRGLQRIVLSPLFQAELQKELDIKQKIERDAVLQSVATIGAKKLQEAVETGKLTFVIETPTGKQVVEKALDGREIIAIAHDALDRTGHKPVNKTLEAHVDLGRMIIEANKDDQEDIIDVEAAKIQDENGV